MWRGSRSAARCLDGGNGAGDVVGGGHALCGRLARLVGHLREAAPGLGASRGLLCAGRGPLRLAALFLGGGFLGFDDQAE